jgi:hypothetical protein
MMETSGACRGMRAISGSSTLKISLCTDHINLPLQTPDILPLCRAELNQVCVPLILNIDAVDEVTSYVLEDPGFESNYGQEIFLYSKTFRPTFGLTQRTFQGVPGEGTGRAGPE